MRSSRPLVAPAGLVLVLAACGDVANRAVDPSPADASSADAWAASCAPPAAITTVEAADAGFSNSCIHGQWVLQALNGTTMPAAPGRPDNTVPVIPMSIPIGFDPFDPSSTFAVHVTGAGQENTGTTFAYAQLTASLNAPSATQIGAVDATAFTGIQFYAIITTGETGARLTVGDLYTDPIGGKCTTTPGQPTSCFDNPGAPLTITTAWTKYQIPFDSLTQVGFGNPSPTGALFPKDAITHIKWDIGIPMTGQTLPWELWVDDLTFY
ncbi:MAG TPA: hypothetical protein VFT22_21390 [Kofleriaceae bacterium]|nr:hypothetical protein [Kofleriaceae bacterium]